MRRRTQKRMVIKCTGFSIGLDRKSPDRRYSCNKNLVPSKPSEPTRIVQQTPPPRTGDDTSLTRLALGFWAGYRKFSATTGVTTSDAALSAPLVAPLVKLNMHYKSVSHNKFSIGKFPIGEWRQKQKSSYREILNEKIPYRKILHREIPYGKERNKSVPLYS